jgi:hypothetical protein
MKNVVFNESVKNTVPDRVQYIQDTGDRINELFSLSLFIACFVVVLAQILPFSFALRLSSKQLIALHDFGFIAVVQYEDNSGQITQSTTVQWFFRRGYTMHLLQNSTFVFKFNVAFKITAIPNSPLVLPSTVLRETQIKTKFMCIKL